MTPSFKSVKGSYDLQAHDINASLKLKLVDNLKAQVKYNLRTQGFGLELHGHQWQAEYNFHNHDLHFEFEREGRLGEIKIKQTIPQHKFELFPSPHMQVKTNLASGSTFADRLKLGYDFQKAVASVEETLFLSDKKLKVKLAADTVTKMDGASVALKLRPRLSFLKALGLRFDRMHGPSIVMKSEPTSALKAAAKVHLKQHTAEAVVKLKADKVVSGVELALHGTLQYGGANRVAPNLRFLVEYEV